ncbi:MAG: hypothetical protein D6744_19130 [Planctomycetota bacterium]|nr:MAG: hypothetical protein D6744_19130 [Planctomycetota bacterium]
MQSPFSERGGRLTALARCVVGIGVAQRGERRFAACASEYRISYRPASIHVEIGLVACLV